MLRHPYMDATHASSPHSLVLPTRVSNTFVLGDKHDMLPRHQCPVQSKPSHWRFQPTAQNVGKMRGGVLKSGKIYAPNFIRIDPKLSIDTYLRRAMTATALAPPMLRAVRPPGPASLRSAGPDRTQPGSNSTTLWDAIVTTPGDTTSNSATCPECSTSLAQFTELSQPNREIVLGQPNEFIFVKYGERSMQVPRRKNIRDVNLVDDPKHAMDLDCVTGCVLAQWIVPGKQYRVL